MIKIITFLYDFQLGGRRQVGGDREAGRECGDDLKKTHSSTEN